MTAWPIRRKLQAMVLLPLVVVLPLLGLILLLWGNVALDRMLITKVRADLAVAHGYFDRVLAEVAASTGAIADSHALHLALAGWSPGQAPPPGLRALLQAFKERLHQPARPRRHAAAGRFRRGRPGPAAG
jgi:two-component system, NtrC family, sensor kinase